ncbi:hypothetical protein BN159_8262 [Streptomyces davaonensis JCM 4913]|uniref:Peptidase C14 caspase domain-containing protein n=1 Tax=Streptomyces davaonensis (strain DSM 101723 / JCM 4913 / KCC S-0913 / 768) TaxID=1214101 RepID=K4RG44_STRDJ|nr:caspase family protein [Streptomyces davaonensis]CCK32640.1 hypothetical protein BN159_8262 [Streptomyces davaonensis JCM 4913]
MPLPDPAASRAVVIGVDGYRTMSPLPTVAAGTRRIAELLTEPGLLGLPEEHCVVLANPEQPAEVIEAVRAAAQQARDTFLLYFAGHGLPSRDGDLCLMLPHADHDRLFHAVRYDDLRHELLTECNAHSQVVILDCCFSGTAIERYMGGPDDFADRAAVDRTYVMTACAPGRKAFAPRKEPYPAFTAELVQTLEQGVPGGPDLLDMDAVFRNVRQTLLAKGRPEPQARATGVGHDIALVRNRAVGAYPLPVRRVRRARFQSSRPTAVVTSVAVAAYLLLTGLPNLPESRSALADHRTADLCSLTRPADFGRFGETEQDAAYGNFDRCDVLVHRADGGVVDVMVDLDGERPEVTATRSSHGVGILPQPAESDRCTRLLVPPHDEVTVIVSAKLAEDGPAPLCEIADVAVERAVTVLGKGTLDRRPDFPPDSLAQQDACALLDAAALDVVPGIDATDPDAGYGNWSCDWTSTTSDLHVDLSFDRGQPPSAEDGTFTQLAGRRALIRPGAEGEDTCLVKVVQRTYVGDRGRTQVETLNLLLTGGRSQDWLRRTALALAGEAAAQVPRA